MVVFKQIRDLVPKFKFIDIMAIRLGTCELVVFCLCNWGRIFFSVVRNEKKKTKGKLVFSAAAFWLFHASIGRRSN